MQYPAAATESSLTSCPAAAPCAGEKLRGELVATGEELQQERSERQQAEAEGEALRLQLGSTKQQLASTAEEAEEARLQLGTVKQQLAKSAVEAGSAKETVEEMKARVSKLNQNFIQTSEWQRLCDCVHVFLPLWCRSADSLVAAVAEGLLLLFRVG